MAPAARIDREEVVRLRLAGVSQADVAERLGCSPGLISKICRQEGIRVRVNGWDKRGRKHPKPVPKSEPVEKAPVKGRRCLSERDVERALQARMTSRCSHCGFAITATARAAIAAMRGHSCAVAA